MVKKGHHEAKHENSERWLLTYSDLITLLLVFFVVMYSVSKADEKKFSRLSASLQKAFNVVVLEGQDKTAVAGDMGPASGNAVMNDFVGLRTQIIRLAEEMGVQSHVDVRLQPEGIAISLSGNLLFDSGRAELRPESTQILDGVADQLRSQPNEIRVEGHTDNIPVNSEMYPTNWELSVARATVVTRYLTEVDGLSPRRLSAQGYGEFRPLVDNKTREDRAQNRRVDILILYPDPSQPTD
ncbi:MAG: OmpA family protein [Chloroflexi bacterium]|nr:OmpA family protein [Chloroflexota bacterium]